jgi:hypothetical protein
MPLYGRGFTLSDPDDNGLYAPAPQPIDAGPYTGTAGFWGYNEVCVQNDLTLITLHWHSFKCFRFWRNSPKKMAGQSFVIRSTWRRTRTEVVNGLVTMTNNHSR